ncbi:hypothetical protein DMH15_14705 [Streptomyces sp. WAC 06725]|nr:hypothetical protein DMH15_14705 [Streptomyces sp. WAC 06725]
MAVEGQWGALRKQLEVVRQRAGELRRASRAVVEETQRLFDENYRLRRRRFCLVGQQRVRG